MPADSSPGISTSSMVAPPIPTISIIRNAPQQRGSQQRADGGEATGRRDHRAGPIGDVLLRRLDRQVGQAPTDGDQRGLRTDHRTESDAGQRGQHDAGEMARTGRPPGRSLQRQFATPTGQVPDDQTDDEAADGQRYDRPPGGGGARSELVRNVGEDPLLDGGGQDQEEVRDGRDRHAEHRGNDQQAQIGALPKMVPGSALPGADVDQRPSHGVGPRFDARPCRPGAPTVSVRSACTRHLDRMKQPFRVCVILTPWPCTPARPSRSASPTRTR